MYFVLVLSTVSLLQCVVNRGYRLRCLILESCWPIGWNACPTCQRPETVRRAGCSMSPGKTGDSATMKAGNASTYHTSQQKWHLPRGFCGSPLVFDKQIKSHICVAITKKQRLLHPQLPQIPPSGPVKVPPGGSAHKHDKYIENIQYVSVA